MLFLIHHGEAVGPEVDPMRPLSERGRANTEKVARLVAERGAKPGVIRHSGKLRARQTAEIYWRCCNPLASFSASRGLQPTDPTAWVLDAVDLEVGDVMLVGHFPHLPRLLARLVSGDAEAGLVEFPLNGAVAVERDGGRWIEKWRLSSLSLDGDRRGRAHSDRYR